MSSRPTSPASTTGFAAWVRSRRVALLLTQEQLAERAGLSVRTVRNLEAGTDLGVPEAEALRRDLATAGTSRG